MEIKLTRIQRLVSQFFSEEFTEDESGQGITEYGAVLAFVALIVAMVFMAGQGMSSSVSSLFNAPVNQLEQVVAYDASGAGASSGGGAAGDSGSSASSGSSSSSSGASDTSSSSGSSSGSSDSSSASSGNSNSNAGGNSGNSNSNAGGNGNGRGNGRGGNTRFTR